MYQPRRSAWPMIRKLGKFAVVTGAASLAVSFALLVMTGPSSGAVAAAATSSPAASVGCHPLSDEGTCYEPGEFCRNTDHGVSGVAGDGKSITCEDNDGWRWEPQTGSTTPTGAATAAGTPIGAATSPTPNATTSAPTESPIPGATTSAPAGAPATGGGTGPGSSGTLAAAGFAIMVVGAGLVFFSRRRSRRVPV